MSPIPRDTNLDSSLALLAEGYTFISKRCQRHHSDIFETRLMLRTAICVLGAEAAAVFYQPDRFTRQGAMPITALKLLLDYGSVQLLDDEAHRWRKRMFMSLMTPASLHRLADVTEAQWRATAQTWARRDQIVLHDEAREVLCRAVCQWAGVPLREAEARYRTHQFAAMIEGAGAVGPRNWWGMMLRERAERWIRDIIERVRRGDLAAPEGSALHVIAWHRDLDGRLLDTAVVAVELINVLRPTVAVARFVTFAALALHEHPECRPPLQAGDDECLELFVQEVRRFYPFFPFVGGRARQAFDWRGYHFAQGTWVLLDLYGTNHDPRIWEEPGAFQPERFRRWDGSPYTFVPQGGGEHDAGHRCAGEWLTVELMKRAVRLLTTAMRYDVPAQDLRIDLSRMPARPASGFVISNARPIDRAEAASPG